MAEIWRSSIWTFIGCLDIWAHLLNFDHVCNWAKENNVVLHMGCGILEYASLHGVDKTIISTKWNFRDNNEGGNEKLEIGNSLLQKGKQLNQLLITETRR